MKELGTLSSTLIGVGATVVVGWWFFAWAEGEDFLGWPGVVGIATIGVGALIFAVGWITSDSGANPTGRVEVNLSHTRNYKSRIQIGDKNRMD